MAGQMRDWPWDELGIVLQIVYAVVLSALIGWEREKHRRPAGLRTHILVAISATMVTAIGEHVIARYLQLEDRVTADPSRVVHGLLTGIGFIGAGTIFQTRGTDLVQGVTTAASLFAVTVLGIAIGLGYYVLAAASALIIFGVLRLLGPLEHGMRSKHGRHGRHGHHGTPGEHGEHAEKAGGGMTHGSEQSGKAGGRGTHGGEPRA